MKNSRRRFLQIAGVSALGLGAKPVLDAFAAEGAGAGYRLAKGEDSLDAKQWAMVIDTRKLQTAEDLEPIIDACNKIHNIPTAIENKNHEIKWIWDAHYHNAFTDKTNEFLNEEVEHRPFLLLCNHCENPPCVRACPTQATFKNDNGIVMMDFHRCIGCRFCMAACPFGARSFNFRDPRPFIEDDNKEFPTRMKGVVEKCNFCAERLAVGKMPACVEASNGAIVFGDLYDEHSEVRKVLKENYTIRRKQTLGTEPSVYYIV
ncbi:4Fe-4S ferredoxin [Desulfosarcina alkanivorans]|uniref:4Fe-4S ferredoxin n=1 Tax=Desulfosarcina alkanivorans TaxID=571177 RepID=A0A5K7YGU3_9BACT|nr:4Fe-4S dicluster domain-containing protein [Desulfosarcina alkanivorans]BBO68258.1 4Fe-4S ferredoxin [Desulfosarcina alkanivorans]